MGRLREIIEKLFGMKTISHRNRSVAAIAATETKVLPTDPDRLTFLIINLGANNAYILNRTGVSATNGIVLTANGGHYIGEYNKDFDMTGDNWFGIAPLGAVNILCLEVSGA